MQLLDNPSRINAYGSVTLETELYRPLGNCKPDLLNGRCHTSQPARNGFARHFQDALSPARGSRLHAEEDSTTGRPWSAITGGHECSLRKETRQ